MLYVDDVERNLRAARALGMQTLLAREEPLDWVAEIDARLPVTERPERSRIGSAQPEGRPR